ncbi:hypothetical protein F5884DRAFT_3733 [Xylogone sp. PMI_703]|nr:hypothetical protein F5884DRAFT_3733 [Xylogone sp. PMI_703]
MASSFEIIKQKGYSFKLDLPDIIKVYSVFHVKEVHKTNNNPLPGQKNPELELLKVVNNEK